MALAPLLRTEHSASGGTNYQLWAKPGYGEAGIPRGILRRRAPIMGESPVYP